MSLDLRKFFRGLGIKPGGTVLVHASLRGSGLSAAEVRDSLLDVLGPAGTLVVPAFTPENSDTSRAYRALTARMTEQQRREFRAAMPPYDPAASPCPTMGALAECVRTTPGAVRSAHPQTSLAALGSRAAELLAGHHPHCHLGEHSPMARLYAQGAQVLLLRVGFEACSAFHLAEYRMTPPPDHRVYRCVVREPGNWISYEDINLYDGDFRYVGARLPKDVLQRGELAGKEVVLFDMRAGVDAACVELSVSRRGMARKHRSNEPAVRHIVESGRT